MPETYNKNLKGVISAKGGSANYLLKSLDTKHISYYQDFYFKRKYEKKYMNDFISLPKYTLHCVDLSFKTPINYIEVCDSNMEAY